MIEVKSYPVTLIETNSLLLTDKDSGLMAIVDPGEISDNMVEDIENSGNDKVEYILLTHGHYDHIGRANELSQKYNAKIVIGEREKDFLKDIELNLSYKMFRREIPQFTADILLSDNQEFMLGKTKITFINTPGHTIGGGCYIFDNVIVAGDTLFCNTVGRTDLPTSSEADMINSLKRLNALSGDYIVYTGHGNHTTLNAERKHNPYFLEFVFNKDTN